MKHTTKRILAILLFSVLVVALLCACGKKPVETTPAESTGDVLDATADSTQDTSADVTVDPTEDTTVDPTEDTTVDPTEDNTEEPTEGNTEEPTEGSTEEPTEGSTEEPTEGNTEEPTEGNTEEPTQGSTQEPTAPTSPNSGSSTQPTTPHSGSSTQPTTPNSGSSTQPTTPNSGSSTQPTTPNSGSSTQPTTPNSGSSTQPTTPNSGSSTQPTTPNSGSSTQPTTPNSGSSTQPSNVKVTEVILNISQHTMVPGDSVTLRKIIFPENASDQKVTWQSSNPDVASVSASGVVTAHKIGAATIIVTTNDGGFSASCLIGVATEALTASAEHELFFRNGQAAFEVTITASGGTQEYSYSSRIYRNGILTDIMHEEYFKYLPQSGTYKIEITVTDSGGNKVMLDPIVID